LVYREGRAAELTAAPRLEACVDTIRLFFAGDVMTGRGIDQILPVPGDPTLHEGYVHNALDYVRLAERKSGPVPYPVDPAYIWGDALAVLASRRPDLRIINLETAVTVSDDAWPDKAVHYRMHPANVGCLSAAHVDCAVVANNHVMDWGRAGMAETLAVLHSAGIATAGAGRDDAAAAHPAWLAVPGKGWVVVLAYAMENAGTPRAWMAGPSRPGVNLLADFSSASVARIAAQVQSCRNTAQGDLAVAVVSIHWGSNWGYALEPGQQTFAQRLLDEAGVDIVFGHSSHHVKGIACHDGKLVLHGCGDLINDYEGIGGGERFGPDLGLLYFVTVEAGSGRLADLTLWPLHRRRLRLGQAGDDEVRWLQAVLQREGRPLGTRVERLADGALRVACL